MHRPTTLFLADRGKAWYFGPVDAFRVWDKTRGSTDVVVAVVDSYFDLNNPRICEYQYSVAL